MEGGLQASVHPWSGTHMGFVPWSIDPESFNALVSEHAHSFICTVQVKYNYHLLAWAVYRFYIEN